MDHDEAVNIVNTLHAHLATVARSVVTALADGKMTPLEGMLLGMQGMNLATYVLTLTQGITPAMRTEVLFVLEHGAWVIPPTS